MGGVSQNQAVVVKGENGRSEVPEARAREESPMDVPEEKPVMRTAAEMKVKTEHANNMDTTPVVRGC